ncbi:hypothetical protein D5085_04655 [Ectothiorhodospiraceae bacterium BW-2]|nr:hypothetical protein D5085_04655 [Ectothiorhodospiraceae bacterium BW-2]
MRKRLSQLWPQLMTLEHLYHAYRLARRGKRHKRAMLWFSLNLEQELVKLQQELQHHTYRPDRYRLFTLYERKPRQIAAAPFRDRVVHHAVMSLIEPAIGSFGERPASPFSLPAKTRITTNETAATYTD